MFDELLRLFTPAVIISMVGAAALIVVAVLYFTSRTAGVAVETLGGGVKTAIETTGEVIKPVADGVREVLESVADRMRLKQREINELVTQKVALAQEVERLKARHIDVTKITAQLRLGLIEVSQQYHSFQQQTIHTSQGGMLSPATSTEFLGLQRATYRSQIGLDLEKLRFAITSDEVVLVHGLRDVRVLGMMDLRCDELLSEIRQHTLDDGKIEAGTILVNDSRLQERIKEHRALVLKEIQSPQSIHHLAGATAEFGLAFLQACLGTGGMRVMEARQPVENGLSFVELCRTLNERLSSVLDAVRARQEYVHAQASTLERDLTELLVRPESREAIS